MKLFIIISRARRCKVIRKGSLKVPCKILTMHVSLMLKLNKAITPRLPSLLVMDHFDLLYRSVGLEIAPDLGLAGVEVDPAHEEGLEGVGGDIFGGRRVPQRDLLLELVDHLLFFLTLFAFNPAK